jgi:hypothetical protein
MAELKAVNGRQHDPEIAARNERTLKRKAELEKAMPDLRFETYDHDGYLVAHNVSGPGGAVIYCERRGIDLDPDEIREALK